MREGAHRHQAGAGEGREMHLPAQNHCLVSCSQERLWTFVVLLLLVVIFQKHCIFEKLSLGARRTSLTDTAELASIKINHRRPTPYRKYFPPSILSSILICKPLACCVLKIKPPLTELSRHSTHVPPAAFHVAVPRSWKGSIQKNQHQPGG